MLARQGTPLIDVVDALAPRRRANRNPLFDVTFQYLPAPLEAAWLPGVQAELFGAGRDAAQFDLSLDVHEQDAGLLLQAEFATDLLDPSTVAWWLECYVATLAGIGHEPAASATPAVARRSPRGRSRTCCGRCTRPAWLHAR